MLGEEKRKAAKQYDSSLKNFIMLSKKDCSIMRQEYPY